MILLRDLIDIPERIQKGDFVLRLTEGVARPEDTLREYVVTPELVKHFDDALSFIRSAIEGRSSKATYLHGSFGAGKSHFMAVLHLILQGNTAARSITELAPVVSKHNVWTPGKKFLLVPYHMIGAIDMESGILGGYVDFIRAHHPEAPIPGVYLAERLFKDAEGLRSSIGDATFFTKLNAGTEKRGWGDLEGGWNAASFENAIIALPGSEQRAKLISALILNFFSSYDAHASNSEAFLSLDKGLSVISKHAAALGYDALILFLDELVLWLASHAGDLGFVHREGQKLAKLVEAQTADRPIPVVSFVARQRDLSELIGDAVPGAEKLNFSDALKHWEGRFHKITLEDRNLPAIAEKRVLKCKTPAAREELNAAFEKSAKVRESVMNILLTSEGDREMFRRVYPFSPALVQTLIAVSSVLQRERTALKVMMLLLVDQRETLQVGDLIPVGDLFDMVAHGDEAFSPEIAIHFENAKRLYHQKLLPMLEQEHGRREELDKLPFADPKRIAFTNDDRLIKTLLLAALVPEVESLRGINVERLAALNHGTIKTPIPGQESALVSKRVRNWAASVGEIRVGEEQNASVSLQLSGVDTESIIEQARGNDNQGNRIRRIREMLYDQLQIQDSNEIFLTHETYWRNTRRSVCVAFRNIRELPHTSLENDPDDEWKLVIDWPFDEPGHGPKDDLSQLQKFRETHPQGGKTLCWVPAFFSEDAKRDLGMLVILEHILSGERFSQYGSHLSPQDRQSAKATLENQKNQLFARVRSHLEAAYGLAESIPGSLDTAHEVELNERFVSLANGFDPQPPAAANLQKALESFLDQAFAFEFPAAPKFETEIKATSIRKVYEVVSAAVQQKDGRVYVDKALRGLVRQIANPLKLGEMALDSDHFVLGHHWKQHFERKARESGQPIDLRAIRQWIDDPKQMGLPDDAVRMLALIFAEQTNRSFYFHGSPYDASLTTLHEQCELREQKLPDEKEWEEAVSRAGLVFGLTQPKLLKALNVSQLAGKLKEFAGTADASAYLAQLSGALTRFGQTPGQCDRFKTASSTARLLDAIRKSDGNAVISVLAKAVLETSPAAVGECAKKAADLGACLRGAPWELFDSLKSLDGSRAAEAAEIIRELVSALSSDEHSDPMESGLKAAQHGAIRLLSRTVPAPPAPPAAPVTPPAATTPFQPPPAQGRRVRQEGSKTLSGFDQVTELVKELKAQTGTGDEVEISLSWRIVGEVEP